ncbi:reverse transcriptase domain-containing protein [Tanacetum coccineum]
MAESNKEKTAFHTSQGVYCYTKMPFGLKNAGATYQRLVDKAFDSQVGRNIEVYVDDLVIKSHTEAEMLRDIDETFRTLRKINMKLNPKKCTFWAVEGMFLGFLSKSAKRSLPLFKTLKKCIKKSDFHWTPEAEQAVKQLKQHLSELPMLVAPKPKEELIVYLSATYGAISAVLMTERGTVQTLVYFISRTLQGPELNYTPIEKLVLSLVFAAKRLRRYFQAHPIVVVTDQPIKQIISRPDVAGRLQKWSPGGNEVYLRAKINNEAEYEALIDGLRITTQMGVRNVHGSVDSKLVANQVLGENVAKEENMIKYFEKVKSLVSGFANFSISQVPRSKNKKADALSNIASTSFTYLSKQVLVEILKEKSIQEKEVTNVVEEDGPTWMKPIIEYLKEGTLPDDKKETRGKGKPKLGERNQARLGERNKNWIEELPHVLWAHRTMIKSSHGDTPFSLTYGMEAVILAEIRMSTYRTAVVDAVHNDEELRLNLDLLEDRREHAAIREAITKLKMAKYYNARVRGVTFRPGDFVYRSNDASHAVGGGKLSPKWEGTYEVTEALGYGAYKLRSMDGTVLPRT